MTGAAISYAEWLAARDARVLADHVAGLTLNEIGRRHGLSRSGVIHVLDRLGAPRRPRGGRRDDTTEARIAEMFEAARPVVEIAAEVGRSRAGVYHILRRLGLRRRMAAE